MFLVLAVIILLALFIFPRVAAHAQVSDSPFPEASDASIDQMIMQFASSFQVNGRLALAIARCESSLDSYAKNTSSTAKGVYQFLDSSWVHYSELKWHEIRNVLSAEDNIELGVWVLAQEGTQPWESSRTCWSPYY